MSTKHFLCRLQRLTTDEILTQDLSHFFTHIATVDGTADILSQGRTRAHKIGWTVRWGCPKMELIVMIPGTHKVCVEPTNAHIILLYPLLAQM